GLIIFGTLLGSISDREKEIYTFSALGLSPQHVGVLFFAEAAVYAVVGGMGGQLLAQIVAQVMSWMHDAGIIVMRESINYSSTNALFAIGVVMATVLISAIYPAIRASKSANPGLARAWRMPQPEGDHLSLVFPFTVSAYDITGVVSFLAEHFRRHDDAGLGSFAASNVRIGRNAAGNLELSADLALAPFDLGVTQHMKLAGKPSEIEGVDEVAIDAERLSGARGDWIRANKVFMADLRKQFLLWRTLSNELIEQYRMQTMTALEEEDAEAALAREQASPAAAAASSQGAPLS
ncbi:MAG: ABC transporter permease, partial [Phycisphaeraceae bacterium]